MLLNKTKTLDFVKIDPRLVGSYVIGSHSYCWMGRKVSCMIKSKTNFACFHLYFPLQRVKLPRKFHMGIRIKADCYCTVFNSSGEGFCYLGCSSMTRFCAKHPKKR